jgi:hypothetical protein
MELIGLLIRLFLALFLGTQTTVTPPITNGSTFRSYTLIENVDAAVLESFPVQIQLNIVGAQPDGCDLPVIIEQRREENVVTVEIYRLGDPAMMCAAVLIPYRERIMLDGGFEFGTYTIIVNDYILEVKI